MTSRERLMRVMKGERADRVPVAPFIYYNAVLEWKNAADADYILGTIDYAKRFGFDLILRNFNIRSDELGVSTDRWKPEKKESRAGSEETERVLVRTPGGTLSQTTVTKRITPYRKAAARTEALIKTMDDYRILCEFQPEPPAPDLEPLRKAREAIGESGILAPWFNGVFNQMESLRPIEDLLMDPYTDPDFYHDFAERTLRRQMSAIRPILEDGVDMVSYAGNIASSTLVGGKYFDEFILPYEKRLIDFIQARCLGVIYHNCGDAEGLIPSYNRLGMRCFESMSEPPYANNSAARCAAQFSKTITLMGNIDQIRFLKEASPVDIRKKARELLSLMKGRSFILGTSDLIEEGTPDANLFALAQSVC